MANHFAVRLDRDGLAEMSCIAGVGGGVAGLVKTARRGRPILALDGCVLQCVSACLANAGVAADTLLVLSDHGVRKRRHADFDVQQAGEVYVRAVLPAVRALPTVHRNAQVLGEAGPAPAGEATSKHPSPDHASPEPTADHGRAPDAD